MKKTFLFSLSVIASLASFAGNPINKISIKKTTTAVAPEDGGNKLSIGLSVGVCIPLQNFGAKTTNTDSARVNGYANTGFHYNVNFGYKFSKYVGGMLMVGGSVNSFNTAAFGGNTAFSTLTASGPHYIGQYLIGPYLAIPIGKKFSVEVRALVGLMTSSYPKLSENASFSYGGYSFGGSYEAKYKSGAAFGYNFGLGGKYMVSDHVGITLHAAYAGTNMVYNGLTSTIGASGTTPITTTSTTPIHMSIGMINITGGIAYCF